MNGIQKFCIYCGEKLPINDMEIKLVLEKPQASCLNCGRPVKKNQNKCECGYKFRDIKCPKCNAVNRYTNRFCTTCGEKLWKHNIYEYKYEENLFKPHLFNHLPFELHNISVYKRAKTDLLQVTLADNKSLSLPTLKSLDSKAKDALSEICSRWNIVSPNYCICCFTVKSPDKCSCSKCGSCQSCDKTRVEYLQSENNNYIQPIFDNKDLKLTSKSSTDYLDSLAPSIGESQFEYRERLKWEFTENTIRKTNIKKKIAEIVAAPKPKIAIHPKPKTVRPQPPKRKVGTGGYCSSSCRHYREEFLDSRGGIVGDYTYGGIIDNYCNLGHSICHGSFCKDYE